MAKSFQPSDLQLVLLSTAARREGGHLMPLPDSVADARERATDAVAALLKNALVVEAETGDPALAWRAHDEQAWTATISEAGRAIIGDVGSDALLTVNETPARLDAKPPTKIAQVVDLLRRDSGASLTELTDATGWLPHTTRAALTGLRKKGHEIEKESRDKITRYRIAEAA